MQFDDKLGCQFLHEALRCKDSMHKTITSNNLRNKTRLKQLSNVTKRQIKEIQLMRGDTHPFFLPTDYDNNGRIKDCMSIVERTTQGIRFPAFEKHAGYLSQLGEFGCDKDDSDMFSNRELPAETYNQAMQTGKLSPTIEDVIVPQKSLPFLSVAAESGYMLTRRICSPVTSVQNIQLTSPTHDSNDIWHQRSTSCRTSASVSLCPEGLSPLDVILY